MFTFRGVIFSVIAASVAAVGLGSATAAPLISNLSDTGTLVTTTYAPPSSTSSVPVPAPYGSGMMTITPVSSGWKLSFDPNSGFFASANNLAGGKTSTFAGQLSFDITFDSAINLTANVFEDGIYSTAGNGRVAVNSPDLASGIIITTLDAGLTEQRGNSFVSSAVTHFNTPTAGTWTLYDQLTGFSKTYTKYHVVIDNDLLAESLVNPNNAPGFAAIAKKDFSIIITTDGSGNPNVPEPASLGVLALGAVSLLARRRR